MPSLVSLPAPLQAIADAVRPLPPATIESLHPVWERYAAQLKRDIPGVRFEDGGELVVLGELSPGCQACKNGTWDCVFTTMRCNLNCSFCCSPHAIPSDYSGSAYGATPAEISAAYARTLINGISFSGGDPFMRPNLLFDWIAQFKPLNPDAYTWVYTNGVLTSEKNLRVLSELGIHEIRFNLAATGYDNAAVLNNVALAARLLPTVTVEIPAIPAHVDKLIASLPDWSSRGVRFLNLHELMFEPGSNSAECAGERCDVVTPDGHRTVIDPRSRAVVRAVMLAVQRDHLPLSVNDCSMQSKLRQLRGRRQALAPLVQAPYEKLLDGTFYESYCAYSSDDIYFFHPDLLHQMAHRCSTLAFARMVRTAPLSIYDQGTWVAFDLLDTAM